MSQKQFTVIGIILVGLILVAFTDEIQLFQGEMERSEMENFSGKEDEDLLVPTVEEVDVVELGVSLSDLLSQDSEKEDVTYKVNYVQVSVVSGREAARGNVQLVQKGGKRKMVVTSPYVSRTVYYLDKVYQCSEIDCQVVSPARVSGGQPFEAFSSLADQPDQIERFAVERTRVIKTAGLLAQCFAFEMAGPMHMEACYTPEGIPLLFKTELGTDGEVATTVIVATSVTMDVYDSEFELPH